MKRFIIILVVFCLLFSCVSNTILAQTNHTAKASPDTVSEKSLVDGEYNFNHTWWYELVQNAHYDEHDFNSVKAFLEQKNLSGKTNGEELSADYRPNDPRTWGGTSWHKADDGTYYLASILFSSYLLRLNHKEKYTGGDLSLSGKLDLSECKYLMYVECHAPINDKNTYSDIDLTKCDKLYWVDLRCNYSDTLCLNGSKNVNSVFIKDSGIKELDISDLTRLETFNCDNTPITGIDFSNCKIINRISITRCSLRNLYVKGLEKLEALNCSDNMLKSVDLSGHEKTLVELNISNNGIGGIADFSAFSALTRLVCDNCDLREINLPKKGAAISVSANGNMLTKIDVKSCGDLAKLYVNSNYLTELDMSDCSSLKVLECANNMLTSLKLGDSSWFSGLVCSNNKLTKLELPDSANFLTTLYCDNNYIEELDISNYHYLSQLSCANNKIKRLVMDGQFYTFDSQPALECFDCSGNPISECLDVPVVFYGESLRLNVLSQGGGYAVCTREVREVNGQGQFAMYLCAMPASGNSFLGWYDGNTLISNEQKYQFSALPTTEITAKFTGERPSRFEPVHVPYDFERPHYQSNLQTDIPFNANDLDKLNAFLAQKDSMGVTNGEKLLSSFSQTQPEKWDFVQWEEINGENRITELYFDSAINNSTHEYVEEKDRYTLTGDLDVSGMDKLSAIFADMSGISAVNTENCSSLFCIAAYGNPNFATLNIKGSLNITYLDLADNSLSSLDISDAANLNWLDVSNNKLQKLENLKNTKLTSLFCGKNQISTLEVNDMPDLCVLSCENNKLTKLMLDKSTNLRILFCMENALTSISLPSGDKCGLVLLDCSHNKLTEIAFPPLLKLGRFDYNEIKTFGEGSLPCESLVIFSCSHNKLTALSVTNCKQLKYLDFSYNEISEFSFASDAMAESDSTTFLSYFDCSNNKLEEITLPKTQWRDTLNYFDCSNNEIKDLDLTHAGENMYYLNVSGNPLIHIKNAPMRYITEQAIVNGSEADKRLNISVYGSGTLDYDLDTLSVRIPNEVKTYIGMFDGEAKLLTNAETLSVNGMDSTDICVCFGLLGDANLDGTVNTADAVTILRFAAELTELSVPQMATANMNGDDKVNTADAVQVLRKAAGM